MSDDEIDEDMDKSEKLAYELQRLNEELMELYRSRVRLQRKIDDLEHSRELYMQIRGSRNSTEDKPFYRKIGAGFLVELDSADVVGDEIEEELESAREHKARVNTVIESLESEFESKRNELEGLVEGMD